MALFNITTTFAPNSVFSSENDGKLFTEQKNINIKLQQKIEYCFSMQIIYKCFRNERIKAFNQRGRFNMQFIRDANALKNHEFETKTNVFTEYITLMKVFNENLHSIVENLENAIKNENTVLITTQDF